MPDTSTLRLENEISDETLLSAIAEGAVWALESLYRRYYRLFYTLAYRMVSDHQIAEDLLQDAFIAVWKRSNTYSPRAGAARNWLISILHHRTIDYLRKLRRRSSLQITSLEPVEFDESLAIDDAWEITWRSLQRSQILEALQHIPPEQRLVVELAYFQGRTHTEIAQRVQIPLGTVKARLRLGLRHLKKVLAQMGLDQSSAEY
jgi:RNA polymerase sigma-70 factor (ECF subfamily)